MTVYNGYTYAPGIAPDSADNNNIYSYASSRDGGLNYFYNSTPITREQFSSSLGVNTNNLESSVYNQTNSPQGSYYKDAPQPTGNDISGGGSAYSAPAYSQDDLRYIDDQIANLTSQKDRIGRGLQTGLTGLEDSYNQNMTTQNEKRSRALQDFDIQTADTTRNKNTAINKVNTNARTLSDSLRRRLGMASGSDSSAYQITAPGAVARDASANRTGIVENYGVNFRNLDIGKKRADTDFATLLAGLSDQRRNSERGLRQGIMEQENQVDTSLVDAVRQRAGLLGGGYDAAKLASAGYESGITNRNAQIDSLFNQYRNPYTIKPVDVQKVNLRDYLVDKAAVQTNQAAGTQDPYSPYTPFKQEDDQYQY